MIPRRRFDIGWADLLYGVRSCLFPEPRDRIEQRLARAWSDHQPSLACLSVRSGFDALLQALALPAGSEVLVSAITIQDMPRIIQSHGLIPVPIDLDMQRFAVRAESMARAVTSRTRAVLVAHLFGSRMPMEPIIRFAREHQLFVIEDCAQSFSGAGYLGHPESDVCLFSFGPIKTATALGGGVLGFRDPVLRDAVNRVQSGWPVQSRWRYLKRLCKYASLVLLSYRASFSAFAYVCGARGRNHDQIINGMLRGFTGPELLTQVRQRAAAPLLALLERRITQSHHARIAERTDVANAATAALPSVARPGEQAFAHTHWVFPIRHPAADQLMRHLWRHGFDATRGASSLHVVEPPPDRPELVPRKAKDAFQQLLFLPVYPGVTRRDVHRLAHAIAEFDGLCHPPNQKLSTDSAD